MFLMLWSFPLASPLCLFLSLYLSLSLSLCSFLHYSCRSFQLQRICYDENLPLFPRIDTRLIRRVSSEPHCGFGIAASTVCVGFGLYDIDVVVRSGTRFLPYGGIPPLTTNGLCNGDYLICVNGVLEDGATCGLGRYCNDRLHPDLCNAVACLYKGRIWLKATMDIFPGDEITIYYGWDYWRCRTDRISPHHVEQISKLNE